MLDFMLTKHLIYALDGSFLVLKFFLLLQILADFDQAFGKIINFLNTNDDIAKLLKGEGPVTMFAPINFGESWRCA